MQTRDYTARFLTPAFLGNAGQDGQWRTPPFKHLLREWWRVAWKVLRVLYWQNGGISLADTGEICAGHSYFWRSR